MRAIERAMRRFGVGTPRSMLALQLGTDVASRIPFARRFYLAFNGMDVQACDAAAEVGGGEWLWGNGLNGPKSVLESAEEDRRLVIYIHGGAFVLCNPATQRPISCGIAYVTQALVLAIDYRRAPQHSFPAALDDVVSVYRTVITSFPSSNIVVGGESAGANLSVALCLRLKQLELPLPGGLFLISPWLDLSDLRCPSWKHTKDFLHPELLSDFARAYADAETSRNELVSPLRATELGLLPPTLLIYGGAEDLSLQGARFAMRLRQAGVHIEEFVGLDMVHGFPVFADVAYGLLGRYVVFAVILVFAVVLVFFAVAGAFSLASCSTRSSCTISSVVLGIAVVGWVVASIRGWLQRARLCRDDVILAKGPTELPAPLEAFRRIGAFATEIWRLGVRLSDVDLELGISSPSDRGSPHSRNPGFAMATALEICNCFFVPWFPWRQSSRYARSCDTHANARTYGKPRC